MAKKKTVAAQAVAPAVELVDTLPDIANLTPNALNELISAAHARRSELANAGAAEREAKFEEAKKSDKVKALKAELKELDKEFSELQKGQSVQSVTYTVPVTFEVDIQANSDGDLLNELANDGFSDVSWDNLFRTGVEGKLGKGDLPADTRQLMQENIDNVLQDACSEALRLTPGVTKTLEAFAKKVNKFTSKAVKVYEGIDQEGFFSVEDLLSDD